MRYKNHLIAGFGLGLLCMSMAHSAPSTSTCPNPPPLKAPPNFMWGLTAYHVPLPGYELYPEDLQKMAANGIKWISVDFAWKRIEPVRGAQYDFSYFDMLTQEAAKNGIQIVGKLANGYNTPMRAVSPEWTAFLSADDYLAEMDKYARAVVSRYGNTVHYWALENELNIDFFHVMLGWRAHTWSPQVKDKIVWTLNQAVHDSAPDAKTILTVSTTLLPTFGNYIQRVSQQVNYDMVGMFDYPIYELNTNQDSLDNGLCGRVATVEQTSGGKPALIMESGYQTSNSRRTPQAQAGYVTAVTKSALHAGVGGVFFYEYLDNPQEFLPREQHFGLLQADRTPKPAWTDYGNLIKAYQ